LAAARALDCVRCGACCLNPLANREEAFVDYIEVKKADPLYKKPELMRRFCLERIAHEPHLKLDAEQRCVALRGRIGRQVHCVIYRWRPAGCRRVEAGSKACLQARSDFGVG
jgi:Fe-S-cluster containining protein